MKTIYKALIAFLAISMLVSTVSADCGLTAYERNVVLEELPSNEIPYDDIAEKVKSKLEQAIKDRQADIIRNIEHPNVEQPVIPRPIPEQRTMMDDILETYTPNQPTQNGGEIHGTEFVGSQSTTMKPSNYQAPIAFIGYVMPDYIQPAIRLK